MEPLLFDDKPSTPQRWPKTTRDAMRAVIVELFDLPDATKPHRTRLGSLVTQFLQCGADGRILRYAVGNMRSSRISGVANGGPECLLKHWNEFGKPAVMLVRPEEKALDERKRRAAAYVAEQLKGPHPEIVWEAEEATPGDVIAIANAVYARNRASVG